TRVPRSKVYTRTIQIDDDLLQYIDTFSKDSTKEIREALYFPHPRPCENSSPLIDFAYKHVRSTVNDCQKTVEAKSDSTQQETLKASKKQKIIIEPVRYVELRQESDVTRVTKSLRKCSATSQYFLPEISHDVLKKKNFDAWQNLRPIYQ
ncbi:3661_t:CDS:2, partial [Funneliformis geosporum]